MYTGIAAKIGEHHPRQVWELDGYVVFDREFGFYLERVFGVRVGMVKSCLMDALRKEL